MSKIRNHLMISFQMRTMDLGVSQVAIGEGSVVTLRSGLPLVAVQNAVRQKGVS